MLDFKYNNNTRRCGEHTTRQHLYDMNNNYNKKIYKRAKKN